MYLNHSRPSTRTHKFKIVLWDKFNNEELNLRKFSNPECPVQNCVILQNKEWRSANAIVSNGGISSSYQNLNPHVSQVLIFYALESPVNFESSEPLSKLKISFDWTMTYK